MSEYIRTSHAVIVTDDLSTILAEKNARFGGKITLFGGKLEDGESHLDGLKRELFEETGINFNDNEIKTLIENDKLVLGDKTFLGFVYYIIISKKRVTDILKHSEKNIVIDTSFEGVGKIDLAFEEVRTKIEECLIRLNDIKLNN
ncbi:MAG: NUDIX domain-containing protein [Candidatus Gracilibacteria bacterium]|nr:NUDIX domain-containing protein [Candidatus Gracilibacteria bacterium]